MGGQAEPKEGRPTGRSDGTSPETTEETAYEDYLRHRQDLEEARRTSIRTLDEKILWLSSGALGLSLTWHGAGAAGAPTNVWLLALGWALLLVAIGLTLWSLWTSSAAYRAAIAEWDDSHRGEEKPSKQESEELATLTRQLTASALLSLVVGLAVLAATLVVRSWKEAAIMGEEQKKQQSTEVVTPRVPDSKVGKKGLDPGPSPLPRKPAPMRPARKDS